MTISTTVRLVLALVVAVATTLAGSNVSAREGLRGAESGEAGIGVPRGVSFISHDAEGASRATTLLPDRSVVDVTAGPDDRQVVWSPTGSHAAILRWDAAAATAQLIVVDPTTGDQDAVTPRLANLHRMAWSPDGTRLAFDADADLWVVDLADGQLQRLTDTTDVFEFDPRWAPDGTQIAYTHSTQLGPEDFSPEEIGVIDLSTGEQQSLGSGTGHDWSTAGIAFAGPDGVIIANPDVGHRQVVADIDAFRVRWSPDTARLVVGSHDGVDVIDLLTGQQQQITTEEAWRVGWMHDGTAVTYITGEQLSIHQPGHADPQARTCCASGWDLAPQPGPVRLGGTTRVETAVVISRRTFASPVPTVVLARADAYADALSGGPLAAAGSGPLLLTSTGHLPNVVADEIRRLAPRQVMVLGDENAVASAVLDAVAGLGVPEVRRIAGTSRYATAAAAAAALQTTHPIEEVFVVEGGHADPTRGWPDAVATSALAARRASPIVLVEHDRLPEETREALQDLQPQRITIVGGTAAVSAHVEAQLMALADDVQRIAGRDRYDTSAQIAAITDAPETVWIATGSNWPDSLTAGPAAAATNGTILLVDGADLDHSPAAHDWLKAAAVPPAQLRITGSPDVLSSRTAAQADGTLHRANH